MNRRQAIGYVALLAGCLLVSISAGWTTLGTQLDNDIYDFLFRIEQPWRGEPQCVIAGIDEESLRAGGVGGVRRILAEGLMKMAEAPPAVVAVDMILADSSEAAALDELLEKAFSNTNNLVLATYLWERGWDNPKPGFARFAKAIGHVHADPDRYDNVVRQIPLEKRDPPKSGRRERHFALSLEAFRVAQRADIIESPNELQLGSLQIPAPLEEARPILLRYRRIGDIPAVTFHQLRTDPKAAERLRGKVVFVGFTAQSASQDRHMTPYSNGMTMNGVEINANAYETLVDGRFFRHASNASVVLFCIALSAAAGLLFARWSGWAAYLPAAVILGATHLAPWIAFRNSVVFPYAAPLGAAWLSMAAAASFQYFVVRRQLRKSEAERDQYQKAIHFVAHEMRSPLTAIQGSSELMGRYKLPEEKRAEMARMINAESKRLARMIQTFLDVERLSAGQMQLNKQPIAPAEVVEVCRERVRPLAENKQITVVIEPIPGSLVLGDRELLEYAVYNLLTNAIKYSPAETRVTVSGAAEREELRISVRDQGIGMDEKELKSIFRKFYRTRKAEQSGEAGTGIGLSLVEQIISHHGGSIDVTSSPGAGSCFTMVLPASHVTNPTGSSPK
jgi:signal transduction histidine kinase